MSEAEVKSFMNPITLEANFLLKAIEKYGDIYEFLDDELLTIIDKLVDSLNKFHDKCVTKIEEKDDLKLMKIKDTKCLARIYQCTLCSCTFRCTETAIQHIKNCRICSVKHRKKRNNDTANVEKLIKIPAKAQSYLTSKLGQFLRRSVPRAEQLKKMPEYDLIEEDLKNVLQEIYPAKTFKTFKFGSRISGVGNINSDLDIFVDIDGSFHNYNYKAPKEILNVNIKVCNALKKDVKWSQVIPIHNARVPIIRLMHFSSKINCDIGFSNSLGYCNTLLMQYFFDLQPLASRMCIIMKEWLECFNLCDKFSTYSFTLMVIFYLQMRFILPSVEDLQKDLEQPEFIGPWISNFKKKSLQELNLERVEATKAVVHEHVLKFFVFYGEFDYKRFLICPYKGEMIKITEIMHKLPERFKTFAINTKDLEVHLSKPMIVQDPLEMNHNVTKGISAMLLKIVVPYFLESAKLLSKQKFKNKPKRTFDPHNDPDPGNNNEELTDEE